MTLIYSQCMTLIYSSMYDAYLQFNVWRLFTVQCMTLVYSSMYDAYLQFNVWRLFTVQWLYINYQIDALIIIYS